MGILSGVVSYLFGLALNLLDAAVNGFLGALGFDLDTFEQYFPAAASYHEVIVGFAIGLLMILFLFQLFKNFGIVLDIEAEEPLKMLGKTTLFLGMIVNSRSIINLILGLLADPYAIFLNAAPAPYKFELLTLVTAMFNSAFANPFMNVVVMILMLMLGWQFLKLTIECVERYIVFYFALYCAPVVFATGAFKSTAQIFKSWCRLVGSQALLLLINIWSIKLFLSFMPILESSGTDMIFTFLMGYAFLKFAQKADTLLRILGLNTASTGDMVRSLGGTVAGIAMTIRTAGRMAQGVASAVGQRFNGTGVSNGKTGESGSESRDGAGDEISGMGGRKGPQPDDSRVFDMSKENAAAGGITLSGISAAKQGFVTDVMRAARAKMEGGPFTSDETGSPDGDKPTGGMVENPIADAEEQDGKIPMKTGEGTGQVASKGFRNLDEETLEGLSNLAHGLPHDKFNSEKGAFSGGGFPAFTGDEANIIGASQLMPADGVERSMVKRVDGSTGTIYRDTGTGEAHMVQFSSVDNGVMQGTISKIDPATGKTGEEFAFKAVHSSVPGAESFGSHVTPVREPSGGVYHVETGADTAIFSAVQGGQLQGVGSAYTPGGVNRMTAPDAVGNTVDSVAAPVGENMPTVTVGSVETSMDSTTSDNIGSEAVQPVSVVGDATRIASVGEHRNAAGHTQNISAFGEAHKDNSIHGETAMPIQQNVESPPVTAGMQQPRNQIRRFSRNNPAILEVFRRGDGHVEAFDKVKPDSDPTPDAVPFKK